MYDHVIASERHKAGRGTIAWRPILRETLRSLTGSRSLIDGEDLSLIPRMSVEFSKTDSKEKRWRHLLWSPGLIEPQDQKIADNGPRLVYSGTVIRTKVLIEEIRACNGFAEQSI